MKNMKKWWFGEEGVKAFELHSTTYHNIGITIPLVSKYESILWLWDWLKACYLEFLVCIIIAGSNWVWPPLKRWRKWGLTGGKTHAVLMKATDLLHLFGINLETMKYFASHYFRDIWAGIMKDCICSVMPDKQLFLWMKFAIKSFFLLLRQGNLVPLVAAEILKLKLLGLRLRLKPDCFQACDQIPQKRSKGLWFLHRKYSSFFAVAVWSHHGKHIDITSCTTKTQSPATTEVPFC